MHYAIPLFTAYSISSHKKDARISPDTSQLVFLPYLRLPVNVRNQLLCIIGHSSFICVKFCLSYSVCRLLYSDVQRADDISVVLPASAGEKNFEVEEKVKLINPKITANGYKIGNRGFTNYILSADDMVKA